MNLPVSHGIIRPRRLRKNSAIREMVAETSISADHLILPIFIKEVGDTEEIASMPGVHRHALAHLVQYVKRAHDAGIRMVALFPQVEQAKKSESGAEAFNPDNLICRAIKLIKSQVPNIQVMADVALDPYTSHGHDGIVENAEVHNDLTVESLVKQALTLAAAGADAVAPSDMMDGRILAIREALEENGYHNTIIISYAAKFCSAFYGPFRDAIGSNLKSGYLDKRSYQMDFRNRKEASKEAMLDAEEGADILLIKPAMTYLDIIADVSAQSVLPVFAYQVSGEYAALKFAALNGALDFEKSCFESLIAMRRAGATAILTYAAIEMAAMING